MDQKFEFGATFQRKYYMPYQLVLDGHRQDLYVEHVGHMSINITVHIGETRH